MLKFLSLLFVVPALMCSHVSAQSENFDGAKKVEVFKDGETIEMSQEELNILSDIFVETFEGSKSLPALGVALDEETKESVKSGVWIKFSFDKTRVENDMPFDELLIKIHKENNCLNVIRGNDGKFDGRCYFVELNHSLEKIYNYIIETSDKEVQSDETKTASLEESTSENEELLTMQDESQPVEDTLVMPSQNDKEKKNGVIELEVTNLTSDQSEEKEKIDALI